MVAYLDSIFPLIVLVVNIPVSINKVFGDSGKIWLVVKSRAIIPHFSEIARK